MKQKFGLLLLVALLVLSASLVAVSCGDDDDDDDDSSSGDDDDDSTAVDCSDSPAYLTGTMTYDGARKGAKIMIAINDTWPMTAAPLYYTYVEIPESGFPFEYTACLDRTGDLYVLALIDVDPDDGVGMNPEIDPLSIPESAYTVVDGENQLDITFINPEELDDDDAVDDDDDTVDDDDAADDDDAVDDDDNTGLTGIEGTITYAGSETGTDLVFGFYEGVPIMAPDHTYRVPMDDATFPFPYEIETDFTGTFKVVVFLDVDTNDGDSINFDTDPTNWQMTGMPSYTITDGQMTTVDVTLVDP